MDIVEGGDTENEKKYEYLKDFNYEDFLCYYKKLLPIYVYCQLVFANVPLDELELEWLGGNLKYITLAGSQDESKGNLEQLLLLTAVLENALGNVYYTVSEKRNPPHLLRDLLATAEIANIFGTDLVLFMQILLGTPKSINLRNIVWHGFLNSNEVPPYYSSVLLLLLHTLGSKLGNIKLEIIQRPHKEDYSYYWHQFDAVSNIPSACQRDLIAKCCYIDDGFKAYWQQIFSYYENKQYWLFVMLILPQIELLLRMVYQSVNGYDVSAKIDEYYITIDTIFEMHVPNAEGNCLKINKIFTTDTAINEGALKLMYDLFVAPNGPRIRDKVSHGEVLMDMIDDALLCRILLYLCFNIITNNNVQYSLEAYESKFHLNSLNRKSIISAIEQLECFAQSWLPDYTTYEFTELSSKFTSTVKIFQRPKLESEAMLLVMKISQFVSKICLNYTDTLNDRTSLMEQRKLSSRRRLNLQKLLETVPKICSTLVSVMKCVKNIYDMFQLRDNSIYCDKLLCDATIRFLKRSLKVCENLEVYAEKHSAEWIKILEMCEQFSIYKQSCDIRILPEAINY
ncbi:endoplasmic reticulum membrane-associated RNA degradation protein-like [Teleopsis dalmanni]|uniref:endoplasmic reticulum membrane-associated RNA degradation protein-like n=1 Tax=Teleopsis dalmanni TaxID=139649 RepID=UPI0018CE47BA|nr:endoplasmic reticulum membrane-associated RNA degradation protein-like [Teleopsis dalmanni]